MFKSKLVVALIAAPLAGFVQAGPANDFNSDTDGWKVIDFLTANQYSNPTDEGTKTSYFASGGVSGGYISATDPSEGSFFFSAGATFLDDLSSYYGGVLNYSQSVAAPSGHAQWLGDPNLILVSGSNVVVYQGNGNPGSDWTSFSVGLSESGWRTNNLFGTSVSASQFQSVLANVTGLYIRGEYINGVVETATLDSVSISAVPEPVSAAMMLAGLGSIALMVRRHRA